MDPNRAWYRCLFARVLERSSFGSNLSAPKKEKIQPPETITEFIWQEGKKR